PFLFITMFILKDGGHVLAPDANTIPQIFISGIASEAPNEDSGRYPAHKWLLSMPGLEETLFAKSRFRAMPCTPALSEYTIFMMWDLMRSCLFRREGDRDKDRVLRNGDV
ncbi:MAG: hypothetical protein ABI456_10355, partial [Ktedonobacteraceae bacterium]